MTRRKQDGGNVMNARHGITKKSHKLKLTYEKIMANKYTNIKKNEVSHLASRKKPMTYDVVNQDSVLGQVQTWQS